MSNFLYNLLFLIISKGFKENKQTDGYLKKFQLL